MRRTAILAVLAAAGMALGFLNQWLIYYFFGAGRETDALFAGFTVPQFVIGLISGPLGNTLVPLLSTEADDRQRHEDAYTLLATVTALFGGASLVGIATAGLWVPILVPGFEGADRDLVVYLSRVQLLGVVFAAQYGVLWATCQAQRQFVHVEVMLIGAFVVSIVAMALAAPVFGIEGMAWIAAGRPAVQAVLLLPFVTVSRPNFRGEALKEAWRRMRPLLLGSLYYKSDVFVDRHLSSMAPQGGLSLLNLATQLYRAATGVLNKALVGPVVPALARLAKLERYDELTYVYRKRVIVLGAMIAVGYVIVWFAGEPLLHVLIGHGGITDDNVETLHNLVLALGGVSIGLVGQVLASTFYALADTRTPTVASIVGFTCGIGFKVAGFAWGGLLGLALGTTAYFTLNLVVLTTLLELRLARLRRTMSPR